MRDAEGGFILISALAALALLALLAGGVSLLVRSALIDARAARQTLDQDALTQAGLELAAYELFMVKRTPAEVDAQRVKLDAGTITLSVAAESGKVDLNGASPELLATLWRKAGAGGLTPESFAARVVDWRDQDDDRGPGGAERSDYAAAGVQGGPANAPFATVDELQHVLGVDARQVAALRRLLTVHNPTGKISVMTASRDALQLLPNVTAAVADKIVALRLAGGPRAAEEITSLLGANAKGIQSDAGTAFEVRVAIEAGGVRRVSVFTIVRPLEPSRPFYVTDARPAS